MLPWHWVSSKGIHPFVCTWGRSEKEDIAGEARLLWPTGRYLLNASSLAPTPVNCGKVFSLSPVLFPASRQRSNSCRDFCSWQYFSSVPQSEHFSCRTSNSSTSGVLPAQRPCPSARSHKRSLPASCFQMQSCTWIPRQEWVRDRVILSKEVPYPKETGRQEAPFQPQLKSSRGRSWPFSGCSDWLGNMV